MTHSTTTDTDIEALGQAYRDAKARSEEAQKQSQKASDEVYHAYHNLNGFIRGQLLDRRFSQDRASELAQHMMKLIEDGFTITLPAEPEAR